MKWFRNKAKEELDRLKLLVELGDYARVLFGLGAPIKGIIAFDRDDADDAVILNNCEALIHGVKIRVDPFTLAYQNKIRVVINDEEVIDINK